MSSVFNPIVDGVVLTGNAGNNTLVGTEFNDQLIGLGGNDGLVGGNGQDLLLGGIGEDALFGNVDQDKLGGGIGNDKLLGGFNNDWLFGGAGDDFLWGELGNDDLNGGEGRDYLNGGAGDDFLNGGPGGDYLLLKEGADIVVLQPGNGLDIILDYQDGQDKFQVNELNFFNLEISSFGSQHTLISVNQPGSGFDGQGLGLLRNTSPQLLHPNDFIFNQAPQITSANSNIVPENQTAAIDVQSTDDIDSEGSGISYSLTGGTDVELFEINTHTGQVSFKNAPDFENPADADLDNNYHLQVTVADYGGLIDIQDITITVADVNEPPIIISGNKVSVPENQTGDLDVNAIDPERETENGGGLTFSLTGGDDRDLFDIDDLTGEVTFKEIPNFENPLDADGNNIYEIIVSVTDTLGLSGFKKILVTVLNLNEAPTITSANTASVPENQTNAINVDAIDPDGDTLTYSITGGEDQNLFNINAVTGEVTFKNPPDFEAPEDTDTDNIYKLQVTVSDSGGTRNVQLNAINSPGLTDVQDIEITVTDVNEAPTITSDDNVSIPENQTEVIDVNATDPDGETENGSGLSYSITGGADQERFAIDENTGDVTFKDAPDFEAPTDTDKDNVYKLQVTVSDSGGLINTQNIDVTVTDVSEAPTITSDDNASIPENQTEVIDVEATDPEGEIENGGGLTYSITGGADQERFTIDENTGEVTFKEAPDFENPADEDGDNIYKLQVTVADSGGLTNTQNIEVTVTDVVEIPPPIVSAALANDTGDSDSDGITVDPTITGEIDSEADIATLMGYFNNGDFIDISSALNGDGTFAIGLEQLDALSNGSLPDGEYTVLLKATNILGTDSEEFPILFTLDRTPPLITVELAPDSDTGMLGDGITTERTVTLVGQTEPNLTVVLIETGQTTTADEAGNFTFTDVAMPRGGTEPFTVVAADKAGNQGRFSKDLTREGLNGAPTITSSPVETFDTTQTDTYSYQVTATDPDNDDLSYTLLNAPNGAEINSNGLIQFPKPDILASIYDFTVEVNDGRGGTDIQSFTVNVIDDGANNPPEFISDPLTQFNVALPTDSLGQVNPLFLNLELDSGETTTQRISVVLPEEEDLPIEAADIIFVVDESGSMAEEQDWLTNAILSLDQQLQVNGITSTEYALIGYAGFRTDDPFEGIKAFENQAQTFNLSGVGDINIYGPGNNLVDSFPLERFAEDQPPVEFSLPGDGDYSFVIEGQLEGTRLDYAYDITTTRDPDFDVSIDNFPLSFTGSLTSNVLRETFTFNARKGQQILLDGLQSDGDGFFIDIVAPNGDILASSVLADDDTDLLLLQESGEYSLVVHNIANETGDFAFNILDTSEATPVSIGEEITDTIAPNSVQFYRLSGTAAQRLLIDVKSNSVLNLELYSEDNAKLFNNFFAEDIQGSLPGNGNYILVVNNPTSNNQPFIFEALNDSVSFTPNPLDPEAIPINLNDIFEGSLSVSGEQDIYAFSADVGDLLVFNSISADSELVDPIVYDLIAPDGSLLVEGDVIGSISRIDEDAAPITAPFSGDYQLVIRAGAGKTGDYRLQISKQGSPLPLDDVLSGTFVDFGAAEVFPFTGQEGDLIRLTPPRDAFFGAADLVSDISNRFRIDRGGIEDGYNAIEEALKLPTRPNALRSIFLITDEDNDETPGGVLDFDSLIRTLSENDINFTSIINIVLENQNDGTRGLGVDSEDVVYLPDGNGGFITDVLENYTVGLGLNNGVEFEGIEVDDTLEQYFDLTRELDGIAWSIEEISAGGDIVDSFTAAVVAQQIKEIEEFFGLTVNSLNTSIPFQNLTGILNDVMAEETATFDVAFTGTENATSTELAFTKSGIGIGSIPVVFNQTYFYPALAQDADGDMLTYQLINAPDDASIDENSGLIHWTPDEVGTFDFTIQVDDGRGGIATQEFIVTVDTIVEQNNSPIITSEPPLEATVGQLYQYPVQGNDPDGDPLIFGLNNAPIGMEIDPQTGIISYTPTRADISLSFDTFDNQLRDGLDNQESFTDDLQGQFFNGNNTASYVVGEAFAVDNKPLGPVFRSVVSFDLTTLNSPIIGATLRLQKNDVSGDPIETLGLFDVTTDVDRLYSTVVESPEIFNDLGTGTSYGTFDIDTVNDDSDILEFDLNAAALSDINALAGNFFSIGLSLLSIDPNNQMEAAEYLFANSLDDDVQQLVLETENQETVEISVSDWRGGEDLQGYTLNILKDSTNEPPRINSTPDQDALVGETYEYQVVATDPNGDPLSYTLITFPEGMEIDAFGKITWQPTELGVVDVEIEVGDGRGGFVTQSYQLDVLTNFPDDTEAPQVNLGLNSTVIEEGQSINLQIRAVDNVALQNITLEVNGVERPIPNLSLENNAINRVTIPFVNAGVFDLAVTAIDAAGNSTTETQSIRVTDPTDTQAPIIELETAEFEANGGVVRNLTDLVGTVTDDNLEFFRVELASVSLLDLNNPAENDPDYMLLAEGNSNVVNSTLAEIDPTLFRNDSYYVRVFAQDFSGNINVQGLVLGLDSATKPGEFTLEFTDLTVPLTGIPIEVNREYSSFNSQTQGDFGFGWNLGFQDADIVESSPNGADLTLDDFFGGNTFTVGTRVALNTPDGRRVGFTFDPVLDINGLLGPVFKPNFVPDPGVFDTLEVPDFELMVNADGTVTPYLFGFTYNPNEYILTTRDGTVYNYEQTEGLQTITDRNGNTLTFTDDGITSSTGAGIDFIRDAEGRIEEIIDPEGVSIHYGYDGNGDLISVIDRTENETTLKYEDPRPHYLTEVIDPLGRSGTRTEYNDQGQIERLIDGDGLAIEIDFAGVADVQTVTDPLNNTFRLFYDERGNVLRQIDPLGGETVRTYDDDNNVRTETDPEGNTTTFTYDDKGNIRTQKDARGKTTTFTYNEFSQVLTTTDPQNNTTTNTYDDNGNLRSTEDAEENVTTFDYDDAGNLTQVEDGSENVTLYDYNAVGLVEKITDAEEGETTFTYDSNGNVRTITTPRNLTTTYTYDNENRLETVTDAETNTSTIEYNDAGERIATIDALKRRTEFEYNDRGLLDKIIYPDATEETFEYNDIDQQVATTDRNGNTTQFQYDPLDRLIGVTDALDNQTTYRLDLNGNIIEQIDAELRSTIFTYDALNRLETTRLPLNQTFTNIYDDVGNLIQTNDFNGDILNYDYDGLGQLLSINLEDDTVLESFTYTPTGQLQTITDERGLATFEYDGLDRLMRRTDPDTTFVSYTYDGDGNVETLTTPSGTVNYAYDALNRLDIVTDREGDETNYDYDAVGNLTQTIFANGVTETRNYDINDRVELLTTTDTDNNLLSSYAYTFDNVGNRLSETDHTGRVATYDYDDLYRVTDVKVTDAVLGNEDTTYTYDKVGNVRTKTDSSGTTTYTYDDNDRLLQEEIGGQVTTYTYDDAGNLIDKSLNGIIIEVYDWNIQGELETASINDNGTTTEIAYQYNTDGIRTSQTVDGVESRFLIDVNQQEFAQVIEEYSPGGIIQVVYTHGNDLISQNRVGDKGFYHNDSLGSVRLLTDSLGTIANTYLYDAYGGVLNQLEVQENSYKFTGEQFDRELENYYLRARYYNTALGRFISRDSFVGFNERPLSLNDYLYGEGNPINRIDPSGGVSAVEYAATLLTTINFAAKGFAIVTAACSFTPEGQKGQERKEIITDFSIAIGFAVVAVVLGGGVFNLKNIVTGTVVSSGRPIVDCFI